MTLINRKQYTVIKVVLYIVLVLAIISMNMPFSSSPICGDSFFFNCTPDASVDCSNQPGHSEWCSYSCSGSPFTSCELSGQTEKNMVGKVSTGVLMVSVVLLVIITYGEKALITREHANQEIEQPVMQQLPVVRQQQMIQQPMVQQQQPMVQHQHMNQMYPQPMAPIAANPTAPIHMYPDNPDSFTF
eukprot:gnl/Dysnectes_brevis/1412_a1594_2828.p1 GENE.gnl/Dysnectes_brevis/1412_a1594_2828~~gnl/Dysnectes_brevis/1412_a1594_2828.p1  ORF type:complete len:197 (+),score=13.14 gnl/Dysnectes_brevis/1412_a1594_2828:33-593(+)